MDDIDRQILGLLRKNARTPASEIARFVGMSGASVTRRIERMAVSYTHLDVYKRQLFGRAARREREPAERVHRNTHRD